MSRSTYLEERNPGGILRHRPGKVEPFMATRAGVTQSGRTLLESDPGRVARMMGLDSLGNSAVRTSACLLSMVLLTLATVVPARAAEPAKAELAKAAPASGDPAAAGLVESEEQLDDGLKRFGYLAGLARGCVVEKQQVELEREALDLSAAIAKLLGTDRAFLFSASFGYGTAIEIETHDCVEVLKRYDERIAAFRASRGSAK